MRFYSHWNIARDVAGENSNLAYLLGSIFPDYFERLTRHRTYESLDKIEERIRYINSMEDGIKKQYLMGTVMHYLCDYCCYAHSDCYFEWIHHRIFECSEQKFYKYNSKDKYIQRMNEFRTHTNVDVSKYLDRRNQYIAKLNSDKWCKDKRIMKLDLFTAYSICGYMYDQMNVTQGVTNICMEQF